MVGKKSDRVKEEKVETMRDVALDKAEKAIGMPEMLKKDPVETAREIAKEAQLEPKAESYEPERNMGFGTLPPDDGQCTPCWVLYKKPYKLNQISSALWECPRCKKALLKMSPKDFKVVELKKDQCPKCIQEQVTSKQMKLKGRMWQCLGCGKHWHEEAFGKPYNYKLDMSTGNPSYEFKKAS